jgi:protein phosphatase
MTSGVTDSRGLQKPFPDEIDVCGLTHRGRVRRENADHFLIASFHRAMQVHNSSIPHTAFSALSADSRGYVFLVADGVGAFAQAADGSARAIRSVAQYLVDMSDVSLSTHPDREQEIVSRVHDAVVETHQALRDLDDEGIPGSAVTTLTMCVAIWPRLFVVHVGDSRAYMFGDDELYQLTHDDTVVAWSSRGTGDGRRFTARKHASALGAQVDPQVQSLGRSADVMLLCTAAYRSTSTTIRSSCPAGSSETVCQSLIDLASREAGRTT